MTCAYCEQRKSVVILRKNPKAVEYAHTVGDDEPDDEPICQMCYEQLCMDR